MITFQRFRNGTFIAGIEPSSNGIFASWLAYANTWKSAETDTHKSRWTPRDFEN
jgi:hypothetical protein